MKSKNIVELLVPAGGEKQFIAAVENGADAVYLGGRLFNARMNAGNFDDEKMQQAIDYAHKRGVKVFVTMNTLMRDDELEEALAYAKFLYEAGADALIIQDLGFGDLVGRALPDFERHLSTQASVYDVNALEFAKELGYERVVPARELSLFEIKELCDSELCDIEVFVHGALCICYSGQCQLSRYYGGRSGNRGQCAQPCRLPYADDTGRASYSLSPKDNCLIDYLGELIEAGVYSFKIEGRMKSPEYVAVVTSIYRKYIDLYLENGEYSVSEEDREALMQIFNRGEFTRGYLFDESGEELMSDFIPKNQGVKLGKVTACKKGSSLIDVAMDDGDERELSMGDGVELHRRGSDGVIAGNVISYLKALGNGKYRIGDIKGEVRVCDILYRTSSKLQLKDAEDSYNGINLAEDDNSRSGKRRLPVHFTLSCKNGELELSASAEVKSTGGAKAGKVYEAKAYAGPFEFDYERPTPKERYESALGKLGNSPFELEGIELEGTYNIRVKMSELNALRRACISELESELCFRRQGASYDYDELCRSAGDISFNHAHETAVDSASEAAQLATALDDAKRLHFYRIEDYLYESQTLQKDCIIMLPLAELLMRKVDYDEMCERSGHKIIPYISNISKGHEDEILESHYDALLTIGSRTPIFAGNLGWIKRLLKEEIKVFADYGINSYNELTKKLMLNRGALYVEDSLELADEANASYPLMTCEHRFDSGFFNSKHGKQELRCIDRAYSSQSLLVPADAGFDKDAKRRVYCG